MGDCRELDPSSYSWEQVRDVECTFRRRTLGPEFPWILKPKEYRQIFVAGDLTLATPLLYSALVEATETAWITLRLKVPDVAVRPKIDGTTAYLQYEPPKNSAEVGDWLCQTAFNEYGPKILGTKELRERILLLKAGQDFDSSFLLVYAENEFSQSQVTRCQILLNLDHRISDGIGARIILGRYLSILASQLAKPSQVTWGKNAWAQSVGKLSPPWISIMNNDQRIGGPEYQSSVAESNHTLGKLSKNPGLLYLSEKLFKSQEFHSLTFTQAQSSALLYAVKQQFGQRATITHLGHAAMILAMLRSQLMSEVSPALENIVYSPCWLNGRRYLLPFGADPDPKSSYIPFVQSYSPIVFQKLQDLMVSRDASREVVRTMLLKATRLSGEQYEHIRAKKNMLPEIVVAAEDGGKAMLLGGQRTGKQENSSKATKYGGKAHPFFLSDGLTENYVEHEYFDSPQGEMAVFQVDFVRFAANAQRNVVVRMSSWREQVTISGEWEGQYYQHDMIVAFLQDCRSIMLSIIDDH